MPYSVLAALGQHQAHPDLIYHFSSLGRSINDVLRGGQGWNVPPLSPDWIGDCLRQIKEIDA